MSAGRGYEQLFHRHASNPILTAADWPYPAHTVFNAGATRLQDGTTLLLCRVEDRSGHSHLCAARSANGIDGWVIDREPTLRADPEHYPEELWGIEDPRITFVEELGKFAIAYTAFSRGGPGVALALTEDFRRFERCGLVMQPDDKDAALLPRRIDGSFALLHRPMTDSGAHIWISFSPDLRNWGGHKLVLQARKGGWWDANKVGLSPPPIETARGWLMLYHGVRNTAAGCLYRLGAAKGLLSGDQFADYAERALDLSSPGEAVSALEKGMAAGAIKKDERNNKVLADAKAQLERMKATLAQQEKEARAIATGEPSAKVATAYFSLRNYAKAAELAQGAIAKGNLKRADDVNMVLGIALANQKKSTDAKKAFAAAGAANAKSKDVAGLWSSVG